MPEQMKADMVIIGAGIAGTSLAFTAAKRLGSRVVLLDDGRQGTTHSATGLVAPRVDYMLRDIDLVRFSDTQCAVWKMMFPHLVVPTRFLIPIDPQSRWRYKAMESLLKIYDKLTPQRGHTLLPSGRISRSELKEKEPNLRNDYFDGALSLWEFMVNPGKLLRELDAMGQELTGYRKIIIKPGGLKMRREGKNIREIRVETRDNQTLKIGNVNKPIIIVNAAGPWIQDVVASFGINLGVKFFLGIQAAVPGHFFNSGVITFDKNGKYCICLPCGTYTQVGPTNTMFAGHPDDVEISSGDIDYLVNIFKYLLKRGISAEGGGFLKAGLRVKPAFGDTNRPVIWSHAKDGVNKLYTLFPGKMSLGLCAATEMMAVLETDGWFWPKKPDSRPRHGRSQFALDGDSGRINTIFLEKERVKSLIEIGNLWFK